MKLPKEYHDLYFQECGRYAGMLEKALDTLTLDLQDPEALKSARLATHSLKGDSLTMGYDAIAQHAQLLEEKIIATITTDSRINLELLRRLSEKLLQELNSTERTYREQES